MRVLLATAILVAIGLTAVASSRPSAQVQNLQAGITDGEKLNLFFDEARGVSSPCTVIGVRGDFVGCRNEPQGQRPVEQWYNLRFVVRIDRPVAQQ